MTSKFIKENLLTVQGKLNNRAIMRHNITHTAEELYGIYTEIKPMICKECNSSHKFIGFWQGYKDTCSNKKCKTVSDRRKATCMKKYGVDSMINRPDIKKKALDKAASKEIRDKAKATCLERWGFENPSQNEEIKRKKEETSMKNYGVKYMNQSPFHDTLNKSIRWKDYIMPSGNVRRYQGYEDKLFDELLIEYSETDLLTDKKDMPEFIYYENGKKHRYFPDCYIEKTNTIYEVKSKYILELQRTKNKLKFQSVIDAGYIFELKVY